MLAFALFLFVFQILLVFVHLAVYATAAMAFGIGGPVFAAIFIVLSVTFVSASLLARFRSGRFVDWYYTAAAYWFGLVHYLFVGAVAFFFVTHLLYTEHYYVPPAVIGGILFGALFLLNLYGTWESGRVQVTRVNVALPDLPASWRGKSIVFMSDLHLGNVWRQGFVAKIADKVNALHPEAVFIGGDVYDAGRCNPAKIIEPFRTIAAPQGVYFVMGNHEYFFPQIEAGLAALRDVGVRILNNEKVDLGGIAFVGVDDLATHRRADFEKVLQKIGIDPHVPNVLIKHEPSHLAVARDQGVALGLFGHTHHGQIFPMNFLTARIYRSFDYGLKRIGNMQVYTSSGAGTWGPPLRLGTKSEIVCITLQRKVL